MNRTLRALALILIAGIPLPADDIVVRHDREDARYLELGQRYERGLVLLNLESPGNPPDGHGALVAPRWVLTAAHVATEVQAGHEMTIDARRFTADSVFLHPGWSGGAGNDIALIRLREPVDGVTPIDLYREADEVGRTIIVVGRGDSGTGLTGPAGNDGRVRGATNRIDGADEGLIRFEFHAPGDSAATDLEGISGPGDSGGPGLVDVDGQVYLVGVSSTQSTRATGGREGLYGVTEYYARVSWYQDWIDDTMASAAPPTGVDG